MIPRILEIRQGILKKNDELARALRSRFEHAGLLVVNLVSSPGSGKTALLERTLTELVAQGARVAAVVGDLATDRDAQRLARSGAPVRQIETGSCCHLEADMVERRLDGWNLSDFEYLFIENVGNLVCTASYDLGEALRVALLCVTEGEDKPLKYPTLFNSADLALITKCDLADACEFDRDIALSNLQAIRPGIPVLEVSSRTGQGFSAWLDLLRMRRSECHAHPD